jgi:hypothetical protein
VIFPAVAVMAAVLAFNLLGDALRDWMDPRMRAYLIVRSLAQRAGITAVPQTPAGVEAGRTGE